MRLPPGLRRKATQVAAALAIVLVTVIIELIPYDMTYSIEVTTGTLEVQASNLVFPIPDRGASASLGCKSPKVYDVSRLTIGSAALALDIRENGIRILPSLPAGGAPFNLVVTDRKGQEIDARRPGCIVIDLPFLSAADRKAKGQGERLAVPSETIVPIYRVTSIGRDLSAIDSSQGRAVIEGTYQVEARALLRGNTFSVSKGKLLAGDRVVLDNSAGESRGLIVLSGKGAPKISVRQRASGVQIVRFGSAPVYHSVGLIDRLHQDPILGLFWAIAVFVFARIVRGGKEA